MLHKLPFFPVFFRVFFLTLTPYYIYSQNIHLGTRGESPEKDSVLNLIDYKRLHPDYTSLQTTSEELISQLTQRGFLEAKLKEIKAINDTLFISCFFLGKQTENIHISVSRYQSELPPVKKLINPPGKKITLPISQTSSFLKSIVAYLEKKGDPFARARLQNFSIKNKELYCELNIYKNPVRTINRVIVQGYEKFPLQFLKYGTKIRTGELFSKTALHEEVRKIQNLRFAQSFKDPEVLFNQDSTEVFLYLKKKPANTFEGFIGFGNSEQQSRLTLNGHMYIELVNNLNQGEQLHILWKSNGNDQKKFEGKFRLPYLLRSPVGVEASLNILKQDTLFTSSHTHFKLLYSLGLHSHIGLGLKSLTSDNLVEKSDVNDSIANLKSTFISLDYQTRKHYDFSILGARYNLELGISFGSRNNQQEKTSQSYLFSDVSYQFKLGRRNYIYLRNLTEVLDSDHYYSNEKFRIGGLNTLRGFRENLLTATSYNTTQLEYRYLVSDKMYVHSISDLGFLKDKLSNRRNTLLGIGLGLQLNTQSGNFKFNMVTGKAESTSLNLKNVLVHLGYIANF